MLGFKDLPYIVNKQIVRCLFFKTWTMNHRLALLGVCHDLRQIALPMVYSTIHVRECSNYDHAPVGQWRLPSPSGRLWDLNVAPFNARDVARFAKSLRIVIFSLDGFEELKSVLEHVTSLDPSGWKRIPKLELWITGVRFNGSGSNFIQYFQSLYAYIFEVFSGISNFSVFTSSMASCFEPFIVQLATGYSINLQFLSMSYPVVFNSPIQLQNLTVLDLKLANERCNLLSFVDTQNLRKLSLSGVSGIYIWKYFSRLSNSDNLLNFAALAELYIESNSYFGDNDGVYGLDSDEESDIEHTFASEYQRICNDWEYDIADRRVVFPALRILRVNGSHFGDQLFKNCFFSDTIDRLYLRDSVDLIENSSWFLDNISANHVCVYIESVIDDYQHIPSSEKILGLRLGSRINSLVLDFSIKIDPAVVNLPILRALQIEGIHFSTLIALVNRLSSLRQLSITLLEGDGSFETGYLDLDNIISEPFSASILVLKIEQISSTFNEQTSFYIKSLAVGLPNLCSAILDREHAGTLKVFALDNCDKYSHFKTLFSNIRIV